MSDRSKEIEILDEIDAGILNRRGWQFVTFFQSRQGRHNSSAHDKAIERALKHERQAGIRSFTDNGVTYYEIWERW